MDELHLLWRGQASGGSEEAMGASECLPTFSWFLPVPVNVSRLLCAHHSRSCHLSGEGADMGLYVQGNAIHMESTV